MTVLVVVELLVVAVIVTIEPGWTVILHLYLSKDIADKSRVFPSVLSRLMEVFIPSFYKVVLKQIHMYYCAVPPTVRCCVRDPLRPEEEICLKKGFSL